MTVPCAAIQEIFHLLEGTLDNPDPDDGDVTVRVYLDEDDVKRTKQNLTAISEWLNTIPIKARYPGLDDDEDAKEALLNATEISS